jgi:hypothetical protein
LGKGVWGFNPPSHPHLPPAHPIPPPPYPRPPPPPQVRNLANEVTKKCAPPCATTDALFYAGTGVLLCRAEDKVVLFDVQQRLAVAELPTPPIK